MGRNSSQNVVLLGGVWANIPNECGGGSKSNLMYFMDEKVIYFEDLTCHWASLVKHLKRLTIFIT